MRKVTFWYLAFTLAFTVVLSACGGGVEPVDLVAGNAAAHGLENVDIISFSRNLGEQGILFLTDRS